jgi:hypothetical protein
MKEGEIGDTRKQAVGELCIINLVEKRKIKRPLGISGRR